MNKKVIAGSLIILAAGIATYFYNKRRNKISSIASDTYNTMDDVFGDIEDKTEHSFS